MKYVTLNVIRVVNYMYIVQRAMVPLHDIAQTTDKIGIIWDSTSRTEVFLKQVFFSV